MKKEKEGVGTRLKGRGGGSKITCGLGGTRIELKAGNCMNVGVAGNCLYGWSHSPERERAADLAIMCVGIVGPGRLVSGLVLGRTRGYAQRGRRLEGDVVVCGRTLFYLVALVGGT